MKRLMVFASILLFTFAAACSSAEEDEVLDYHNDLVDELNPKMDEIDALYNEMSTAATDEEVDEIFQDKMIPLTEEVQTFFDEQEKELETDVAKDYHEMRKNAAMKLNEAITLEYETIEQIIAGELEENEIMEAIEESENMANEALELDAEAEEKWEELSDEYDFEEVEEE